jgi:hypothetical protein
VDTGVGRRAVKACRVSSWEEPLTAGVELTVLHAKFDLVRSGREIEPGAGDPGIVRTTDQIERRQTRINIEAGHPQHMILKPQSGGLLRIGIGVGVCDKPFTYVCKTRREPRVGGSVKRRRHLGTMQMGHHWWRTGVGGYGPHLL